jgi:hypothetical protein
MLQIKTRSYLIVILCLGGVIVLPGAIFLWPRLKEANAERKCGISHIFSVPQAAAFLPDGLALTSAIDAVRLQGFDTNRWRATAYAQTKAPNGTQDRFLCRNVADDNRGIVTFTNKVGSTRHVDVRLSNSVVICVVRSERRPLRQ